ncbi:histone-lysine N-methyltransferase SETMAR [Plakobranchus ocellatus]|uniref:Histone-lysine N-methyltransferase SETMAR n=1 Tax=Plakobranchus ocellatus TaxID=259542 RepID=A0AAV4CQ13_9GAST|nr:histone-lysine N-methyltransferase SETMAR [Plakobranchus ocellatus]
MDHSDPRFYHTEHHAKSNQSTSVGLHLTQPLKPTLGSPSILARELPDLAPSDFHLFGPLKRHLGGMVLETEDDLISELRNWFDNLDVDFFRVGINSLLSRWQKCIDLHGDYVEK